MTDLSSMYNDEIHTFSWGDDQMQAPAATEVDAPDTGSHFVYTQPVLRIN